MNWASTFLVVCFLSPALSQEDASSRKSFEAPKSINEMRAKLLSINKNRGLNLLTTNLIIDDNQLAVSYARVTPKDARGTVVLVHGTPSSLFTWAELVPRLADLGYDTIAPDLIGHGLSGGAEGEYTWKTMDRFLLSFLDKLQLSAPVALVGNSYGGEVCWRFAIDHPARVSHLVLIGSSGVAHTGEEKDFATQLLENTKVEVKGTFFDPGKIPLVGSAFVNALRDGLARSWYQRPVDFGERLANLRILLCRVDNLRAVFDLSRSAKGGAEDLLQKARIRSPVLLLWGSSDQLFPRRHAERFQELIGHAQLLYMPKCGHTPQEENPRETAQHIQCFLSMNRGDRK